MICKVEVPADVSSRRSLKPYLLLDNAVDNNEKRRMKGVTRN